MSSSYKEKSRDADFKQHANKIYTAIREIVPEYAEKRAIWELFQNALDVIDENGIIKISRTNQGLKFEHNGKPFTDGNLTGLIKQTSDGKVYGSNEVTAGQYGTGFLSTHVYGKTVILNASLFTDSGKIKHLKNFVIDRHAQKPEDLFIKIQTQDENAENICDTEGNEIDRHLVFTSFEYIGCNGESVHIDNMLTYLPNILPYIFTFNNKLDCVEVYNNEHQRKYSRINSNENSVDIELDKTPYKIDFIFNTEHNIRIILPQKYLSFKEVPKLFLFYPLMETTMLGFNFIIHAQEFKPNKERDFLHLTSSNIELAEDVKKNKELLNIAFELVTKKVIEDELLDFLSLLNIHFFEVEDSYLKTKKTEFINSVKELNRIIINDEKVALTSISFLHDDILNLEESKLLAIYPLLAEFYKIPDYNEYVYLSKRVNNWSDESFTIICFNDILEKIASTTKLIYSKIKNQNAYIELIKVVSTDFELLNKITAIPNIHNNLNFIKDLKKWDTVEQPLGEVMDAINCEISKSYLHNDFYFIDNVASYKREHFKDDLNKFNNEIINLLEKDETNLLSIDSIKFNSIIESLTVFINLNNVTNTNTELSAFYKRIFDLSENDKFINNPTVDLNYDSSFKLLSRLYVKYITLKGNEYINQHITDIKEFVSILHNSYELKKNLLDKLECFPNQQYGLKAQTHLKIDNVLDDDFKNKYREITKKEIRNDLLLDDFKEYISHSDSIKGIQLGDEMERTINESKEFLPITESNEDTLPVLIDLIEKMSDKGSQWAIWLPNINKVKEEILMYKFQDVKTRSSLFNILTKSKETINLLGDLSQIDDLESLIKAGKEKQKEEARKNNHLNYIKEIGLKIQTLVQNQLDTSLAETIEIIESTQDEKLETLEEQNGQDFIVYKSGNPIYYIEVKSRWDSEGIVALSKRQIERCAKNEGKYAVITVNVADFKARNNVVDENISFEDLQKDIYVNTDLSDNFEKLIKENLNFEAFTENTKLIEFRGHIPQDRIRNKGISFESFVNELKTILLN